MSALTPGLVWICSLCDRLLQTSRNGFGPVRTFCYMQVTASLHSGWMLLVLIWGKGFVMLD